MSLKKNIVASYASQIYITAVGILTLPLHIKYMGAEAYGLVGFFAMLQAWFNLLDMGLIPAISREAARYKGGATDLHSLRQLLRTLEGLFFAIAIIGSLGIILTSNYLANEWFDAKTLSTEEIEKSIFIMSIIIAFRWVSGLYRGMISGLEHFVWLSWVNAIIATIRFILVIPFLLHINNSPLGFFIYQLLVAFIEFSNAIRCFYDEKSFLRGNLFSTANEDGKLSKKSLSRNM